MFAQGTAHVHDTLGKEVCACSPGWLLFCEWPGVAGAWVSYGSWPIFGGPACTPGHLVWVSRSRRLVAWPCISAWRWDHPGPLWPSHPFSCLRQAVPSQSPQPQGVSLLGPRQVSPFCFLPLLNRTLLGLYYPSLLSEMGSPGGSGASLGGRWGAPAGQAQPDSSV